MGRRTLLLITSILVAAVGTALIAIYVRGADSRAQGNQQLVSVLVVQKDVAAGVRVQDAANQASWTTQERRRGDLPADALSSTAAIQGQSTVGPLLSGQILQAGMFSAAGKAAPVGISPTKLGTSFQLTDPERAAGLLVPGEMVTVFGTKTQGVTTPTTSVILPKVRVIQIGTEGIDTSATSTATTGSAANGSAANGSAADAVPRTVITFDLTSAEAIKLLDADAVGDLTLGVLGSASP
jgi:pilus assembly protein CpaB